jgi:hypothetical protein
MSDDKMPDPPEGCYWQPIEGTEDWELYVGGRLAGKVMAPDVDGGPWKAWMTQPDTGAGYGGSPKSGKAPSRKQAALDLLETIEDDWRAELMALKSKPEAEEQLPPEAPKVTAKLAELAALADLAARTGFEKRKPALTRLDWAMIALVGVACIALGIATDIVLRTAVGDEEQPACLVSEHPLPWASWSIYKASSDAAWACAPTPDSEQVYCVRMVPAESEKCAEWSAEHIRKAEEVDRQERGK